MVGILKKIIIDMIDNEKFWEIMFDALKKTSQEDWVQFVKEHDMGGKEMKQIYTVENFNADNYGDENLSISVTLNKCTLNNEAVFLDKYRLSFDCIERIVYDKNAKEQLILYSSYEKKDKQHNVIIKVEIEDFNDLRGDWIDFIGDMFMMALVSKEEEGPYGTYC